MDKLEKITKLINIYAEMSTIQLNISMYEEGTPQHTKAFCRGQAELANLLSDCLADSKALDKHLDFANKFLKQTQERKRIVFNL